MKQSIQALVDGVSRELHSRPFSWLDASEQQETIDYIRYQLKGHAKGKCKLCKKVMPLKAYKSNPICKTCRKVFEPKED